MGGGGVFRGEKSWGGLRAGGRGQGAWEPPAAFESGNSPIPAPSFLSQTHGALDHGYLSTVAFGALPRGLRAEVVHEPRQATAQKTRLIPQRDREEGERQRGRGRRGEGGRG